MKISRTLFAVVVMSVCALLGTQAMAGWVNGTICRAANLNQAFDLAWDHMRVQNKASTPRWIICPIEVRQDYYTDNLLEFFTPQYWDVTAWFGTSAASGASVYCIWREVSPSETGTAVADFLAGSIIRPAATPLPSTATHRFTIDGSSISDLTPQTVTCRLDPGTGLNGMTHFPALH